MRYPFGRCECPEHDNPCEGPASFLTAEGHKMCSKCCLVSRTEITLLIDSHTSLGVFIAYDPLLALALMTGSIVPQPREVN